MQNRISISNQISILSLRNKINLQKTVIKEERVRISIQYGGAIFPFMRISQQRAFSCLIKSRDVTF